jgi:hypothetical protein
VSVESCLGTPVELTYDDLGARTYRGYDRNTVKIIVVGDLYVNGAEVNDEEAFPIHLARIRGVSVANHGLAGFGPDQSFLNLKKKIDYYPKTEIVILGIMYENIYRMLNSYRPVLYDGTSDYTLKPFLTEGRIEPLPSEAIFADLDAFVIRANAAFDNDFWSCPRHDFPYSLAFFRALGSNYLYFRNFQKRFRKLGLPQYFLAYRSEVITANLIACLRNTVPSQRRGA